MRLSESVDAAGVEVQTASPYGRRNPIPRRRTHTIFYVGMSGALLLTVLIGFAPTLYLRPFFEIPERLRSAGQPTYPAYLLVHGIVLTAWFVALFVQTSLVAVRRTDLHRRLGWAVAGLAGAVIFLNLMVTMAFVPRLRALGINVEASMAGLSGIVWRDSAALLSFCIFLSTAVVLRRQRETHKRLMLLASISIIGPAFARIWRWSVFDGLNPVLLSLGGALMFLLALALHDMISTKRLHFVTLLGGSFFFGSQVFAFFVISTSELGQSFVRWLG